MNINRKRDLSVDVFLKGFTKMKEIYDNRMRRKTQNECIRELGKERFKFEFDKEFVEYRYLCGTKMKKNEYRKCQKNNAPYSYEQWEMKIKNKYIKISSVKPYNPVFIEVVYVGNVNGYLKTDIYITSAADGIVYVFTSKKDAYGDLDGGLNLYRKGNDLYLLIGDGITGMKDGGLYIRGTEISTDVIDSVDGLTFVKNICK